MIKIDEYQLERQDKYSLKLSKNVITKNDKVKLEFVGYYSSVKQAILSIIKHRTEDELDYLSMSDYLDSYEKISEDTLDRLEEML